MLACASTEVELADSASEVDPIPVAVELSTGADSPREEVGLLRAVDAGASVLEVVSKVVACASDEVKLADSASEVDPLVVATELSTGADWLGEKVEFSTAVEVDEVSDV